MPRRAASGDVPRWDALLEDVSATQGYFTPTWARSFGISEALLRHHVAHGRVERVARGIYRFAHYPRGPQDEFIPLALWSGMEGFFSHETALMLLELSDALPERIHLTLPLSWKDRRVKAPPHVVLHYRDVPADEQHALGPLLLTTPRATLRDLLREGRSPELTQAAAREARARGLLLSQHLEELYAEGLPRLTAPRRGPTR